MIEFLLAGLSGNLKNRSNVTSPSATVLIDPYEDDDSGFLGIARAASIRCRGPAQT